MELHNLCNHKARILNNGTGFKLYLIHMITLSTIFLFKLISFGSKEYTERSTDAVLIWNK